MKRYKQTVTWSVVLAVAFAILWTVLGCGTPQPIQTPPPQQQPPAPEPVVTPVPVPVPEKAPEPAPTGPVINWQDEPAGILAIQNNVDDSLVLFAGGLKYRKLMGGIRPDAERSFDVFDDLPSEINNGVFMIRAVRESVYMEKKNAISDDDVIFAQVVMFDRNRPTMRTNILIDSRVGGAGEIFFENDSNLVLEIRLDTPTGERIATLAPLQRMQPVHLKPNDFGYTYFPSYIYYDDRQKDKRTITLDSLKGGASMRPVVPNSGEEIPRVIFTQPDTSKFFSPVANLIVVNESAGGILFLNGTTPQRSTRGIGMINSGGNETFELSMIGDPARELGGLQIDPRQGSEGFKPIDRSTYIAGYNYTLTFRDDHTMTLRDDGPPPDANKLSISLVNEL
jgi:hypothetical protein